MVQQSFLKDILYVLDCVLSFPTRNIPVAFSAVGAYNCQNTSESLFQAFLQDTVLTKQWIF